jgi:hypothetical protein
VSRSEERPDESAIFETVPLTAKRAAAVKTIA